MEVATLVEVLVLLILFGTIKVIVLLGSPPMMVKVMCYLLSFLQFIMVSLLCFSLDIHEPNLVTTQLLSRINELEFHEYSSLPLRISSLINHAPNLVLHHIFREANLSVDWLAKYINSSIMGVTTWFSPSSELLDKLFKDTLDT